MAKKEIKLYHIKDKLGNDFYVLADDYKYDLASVRLYIEGELQKCIEQPDFIRFAQCSSTVNKGEVNFSKKEKAKTWQIKDTDGEKITVQANSCRVEERGVFFYMNDKLIGSFSRYSYFKVIKSKKTKQEK